MASREDMGSWLGGSPGGPPRRPQDVLGLPAVGPGSLAPLTRRLAGLVVDWLLASVVSTAFLGDHALLPLAVFAVYTAVLVSSLGGTIGHRLLGLQVVRLVDATGSGSTSPPGRTASTSTDARGATAQRWPPPGFVPGVTRTVLLCLVIPAAVWDSAGRGMHDVAAGTVVVLR